MSNKEIYGSYDPERFFKIAAQNREMMNDIHIVIPVRPTDGLNVQLAQALSIWYGEGIGWSYYGDHMGGFIECTRAGIAYNFSRERKGKPEHPKEKFLLMIDNDIVPPLDLPFILARHDKPVVGSCAMSVTEQFGPMLCFTRKDENDKWRFPVMAYPTEEGMRQVEIPRTGLMEVGHVGTGAMMIRRDVLESFRFTAYCKDCDEGIPLEDIEKRGRIPQICPSCGADAVVSDVPFFVPEDVRFRGFATGQLLEGEDISFCKQVRDKGISCYVDLEAHCGHRKIMNLKWDESQRRAELDPENWITPAHGVVIGNQHAGRIKTDEAA